MPDLKIDTPFTTQTLQKLVQINSINPGLDPDGPGEEEIASFIYDTLNNLSVPCDIETVSPGRVNVTARIAGKGDGPSLMLNAHTDTVGVSGMEDPFSGRIEGNRLYGRGSYDMKGSIAAILGTAKAIKENNIQLKGDLILSFVADEEHESIGAQALVNKITADAAIVTEPTDLNLCLAHRGFGIFKITTDGKTAHGGRHKQGVDANMNMGLVLAELHQLSQRLPDENTHPLCGEASLHVPLISGGRSLFVYSNQCTIHAERRTIPGETLDQVTKELQTVIDRLSNKHPNFRASLETEIWRSPYEVDSSSDIVSATKEAATEHLGKVPDIIGHTWWEDSAIFGEAGIESVIIGPKGGGIHEDVEWVELDSVHLLAEILYKTAINFCIKEG
ncbi:ArgE/DapE family deacylase [Rhodohalobacter sp. 8-1]|uniref:ArgE/DapE family deacylase n=1 Tax=Rhodohalobacter sp. 8-1 TaxID=3131972 RepID=UPI0030EB6481